MALPYKRFNVRLSHLGSPQCQEKIALRRNIAEKSILLLGHEKNVLFFFFFWEGMLAPFLAPTVVPMIARMHFETKDNPFMLNGFCE